MELLICLLFQYLQKTYIEDKVASKELSYWLAGSTETHMHTRVRFSLKSLCYSVCYLLFTEYSLLYEPVLELLQCPAEMILLLLLNMDLFQERIWFLQEALPVFQSLYIMSNLHGSKNMSSSQLCNCHA